MATIEFSGTVTLADYVRLYYFHMLQRSGRRLLSILALLLTALFFGAEDNDVGIWIGIFTVFFLFFLTWNPYRAAKQAMKKWVKDGKPHHPI